MNIAVGSIAYDTWKQHSCSKCGRLLSEGLYSVMVIIEYEGNIKEHYKLMVSPPIVCCEGVLEVQQLFTTRAEANLKAEEVHGRLRGLTLGNAALLIIHSEFARAY